MLRSERRLKIQQTHVNILGRASRSDTTADGRLANIVAGLVILCVHCKLCVGLVVPLPMKGLDSC